MANNMLNRYLFENLSVRGELVQLDETYQKIITSKEYPAAVQRLLGELVVATTLLTATLKFEGSITVQLQGDGPLTLAVINGDNHHNVRGVARCSDDIADNATIHDMLGKGHIVITVEPKDGERYQGVVGLEGKDLAEIIENYFDRSEQLKTRMWLRVGEQDGHPHAAGMLIQVMPDGTGTPEDFERLEQLTDTIKDEELFTLEANELLYRLYNQETVNLYEPKPVTFFCSCSRERSAAAIMTVDRQEVDNILAEEGHISLHCDYCGSNYTFDPMQVAEMFVESSQQGSQHTH